MTIRLLIAEDHDLVRNGIRTILRQHSDITIVGEARDGAEAIEMSETLDPDVVLMDISMPGINGVEATRTITARGPRPAVLVLTAYDDDAYVFALLEAGAVGYLLKSSPGAELGAAIRAAQAGESVLSPAIAQKVMAYFAGQRSGSAVASPPVLTDQEVAVLRLAAAGMENRAIALELGTTVRMVQRHLAQIFEKLGVSSRTGAVVAALKRGWLQLDDIE